MDPTPDLDGAALLADLRRRTEQRVAVLRGELGEFVAASRDTNADDEHDPEGATIAFERSQVATLLREARARLDDVAAAEERLALGTWGTCVVCGRQVPAARLAVRPTATTCVACA